ncbi:MAG TPA: hypothetical protein VNO23_10915 [Candidatus Binatia bacterium]|nr:hypothetical protein [Candidatus Binatia bacterium]
MKQSDRVRRGLPPLMLFTLASCASLPAEVPTRAPEGRGPADIAQDERACVAYAESFPKDRSERYADCMIARGYTVNVDLDELGWIVGVAQTRPHQPDAVRRDLAICDRLADNTKSADVVTLTAEQEKSLEILASQSRRTSLTVWDATQRRPNASRRLVACLGERGYEIRPWVPLH